MIVNLFAAGLIVIGSAVLAYGLCVTYGLVRRPTITEPGLCTMQRSKSHVCWSLDAAQPSDN